MDLWAQAMRLLALCAVAAALLPRYPGRLRSRAQVPRRAAARQGSGEAPLTRARAPIQLRSDGSSGWSSARCGEGRARDEGDWPVKRGEHPTGEGWCGLVTCWGQPTSWPGHTAVLPGMYHTARALAVVGVLCASEIVLLGMGGLPRCKMACAEPEYWQIRHYFPPASLAVDRSSRVIDRHEVRSGGGRGKQDPVVGVMSSLSPCVAPQLATRPSILLHHHRPDGRNGRPRPPWPANEISGTGAGQAIRSAHHYSDVGEIFCFGSPLVRWNVVLPSC
ncbi:hypothetical protein GGTG_05650 [Gaeumannomyces tritici R3-111a-1]|uniref:Uncharacterized protein n=1 Tax=Gaeumannomyces tritici (strain R3-111a-1) TaxID=644352 RepID=J3NWI7_GAET3|nr:hypothetical protein GGTG_05650 [Gaeumannomyces tritici R3-111a-1]EJT75719.1 hypothetical protein GGTG_05650 [Gaeumannomyces tritici R3-111a-1]